MEFYFTFSVLTQFFRCLPIFDCCLAGQNFIHTVCCNSCSWKLSEEGEAVYHALTHAQGFYRDFFKLFKGMFQSEG